MKRIFYSLLLAVCGLGAFAQSPEEKNVDVLIDGFTNAIVKRDSSWLKANLAEDCKMTDPGSQVHDKKAIINVFCNKVYDVAKYTTTSRQTTISQDTAKSITTADIVAFINQGGSSQDQSGIYNTSYIIKKQGAKWLLANILVTIP